MKKYVVLVCVVSILLTGIVVAGCGGGSSSGGAEDAAKAFFSAYEERDPDATWELLSADSKAAVKQADWATYLKESEPIEFTVGEVTENGDKATAEVTGKVSGESSTETIPLVKEDGAWKVDMAGVQTEQ